MKSEVSAEEREALLEPLEGSRIASAAVRLLLQVSELRQKFNVGNLQPTDILLEAGLTPGVKVRCRQPAA